MPDALTRVQNAQGTPGELAQDDFETQASTPGQSSRVARLRADYWHRIRSGRSNPFRVAIPAYEGFTSDGTADNTETFSLSHELVETPNTQDVVVWLDGTYYGTPDAIDYDANTVDVTDSGTDSNVHVWYIVDEAASLSVRKAAPSGTTSASKEIESVSLSRMHLGNQFEQPEYFSFSTELEGYLATEITLDVYVNAPYEVRFEDPDGDGASATNLLLSIPVERGSETIPGLKSAVKADMG
ncbi:hypothetical protein [Halocalculus aciditolerans]|uniref:Uncharacterized protein n=1 Tax=Halocalculus aciditolerans TaxID=1383812 RepID=A0A830FB89_9EURY|nr:hypothetical protein [Halocalculus aciditolerans]GGL57928.1 hypothetical protein GCM10009039_15140 [Halocalculus aciditolerans]